MCPIRKSNTSVKRTMHHIQAEKQAPRLGNILNHNRSEMKNDNPLNALYFTACAQ